MTDLVPIDQAAVMKALNLDPRQPQVQALLLVAQRYELDPVLGHLCLVNGTVMVRKNGLLHIAHRSGDHDGHRVDMEERPDRWVATATVFRKSMQYPVEFTDHCMKTEKVQSPMKRARTRALRNALAEAYDVSIPVDDDDDTRPLPTIRGERMALEALPAGNGREVEVPVLAGSPPVPVELSTAAKSLMARARALAMPDDVRHALVGFVTKGRVESVKEISDSEASDMHMLLAGLAKGDLPADAPDLVADWAREQDRG